MTTLRHKNILVTGSTGLVGINLLKRLAKTGARVRAVWHVRKPVVKAPTITYVQADLTLRADCDRVVKDIDFVFHCAANTSGAAVIARTPLIHVTPNVVMNAQLLEAAYLAKVKKFLWISSSTGYPVTGRRPVKESEMFDGDPYEKYFYVGWMKRYTEILCRIYGEKLTPKMTTIVLRPTNIYGDHDDFRFETSHVMAALIRKVVERHNPIEVWGDGNDVRDLIYVGDFVDAMILAMRRVSSYSVYNIGLGRGHTVKQLLKMIASADGYKDYRVEFNTSKPQMIPVRRVDLKKIKTELGFEARTTLEKGIVRTLAWYRNNPVTRER